MKRLLTSCVLVPILLSFVAPRASSQCAGCTGYSPVSWPAWWVDYTYANGALIQDPSDQTPLDTDIFYTTAGAGYDPSSVTIAYDGTMTFFRIQLASDPASSIPAHGGFRNNASYLVMIADALGNHLATVGVDAKGNDDYSYVTDPSGTTTRTVFRYSVNGYTGMRSRPVGGTTNFYLEWQIPMCELTCISGGAITATTPVKLYYGTSSSNQTINKDFMTCTGSCTVSFANLALATFNSIFVGVLPVELSAFRGRATEGGVILDWRTTTEANNRGFDVLRATGAGGWASIGFVDGAGTSNTPHAYRFVDSAPPASEISYRLKQIDRDGRASYSGIVNVAAGRPTDDLSLYPNPAGPGAGGTTGMALTATLARDTHVLVDLFDAAGARAKRLFDGPASGGSFSLTFNTGDLPAGLYHLVLISGDDPPRSRTVAVIR